jgi:hypothetical protein
MMVNGPPIFRIGDAQALSQDSTDGEGVAAVTRPRFSLQLRERIIRLLALRQATTAKDAHVV